MLKKELETYDKHKSQLFAFNYSQWVLIQDDQIIGIKDTYKEAIELGYESFGIDKNFLVKQVVEDKPVFV